MTDCTPTRTRRVRGNSPLEEILWNRDQDRQSSFIAAEERAKEAKAAPSVADLLTGYDFARDEWNTLVTAQGVCTQAAMRVTSRSNPADCYLVIARLVEGGAEWISEGDPDHGREVIAAVQARIEANRRNNHA